MRHSNGVSASSSRVPQIQALRAFAALLVIIFHAKITAGGYIGVDIFYVISGFLITGLILRELEKTGKLDLRAFYLRRIKRLLPTSFVVLMVTAVVSWLVFPSTMREELGKDIFAAAVYVSNFLFAIWQMDYQNLNALPPVVIHYWSLAVEEQFYLFWPIIIFLLYKSGGRRRVGYGVLAITLASFLFSLYLTSNSPIWAFYSLPTRAWELGAGALLLFLPKKIKLHGAYTWLAIIAITYASIRFTDNTPFPGRAALLPVLGTMFALASIGRWPKVIDQLGVSRFSQWLGEISYPLYLWHWPLLVIPVLYLGRSLHLYERGLAIIATVVFADLTHRFLEEPLRHIKASPRTIVTGGVIASLIATSTGVAIYMSRTDEIKVASNSYSLAEIMAKPKVYGDDCHVNNGETRSHSCTYGPASNRRIVLFGDSHAAQWFPALEKLAYQYKFQLISLTKSACPGPAVIKVDTGEYKNSDCSAWRKYAYNRIRKIHPDAVLVSGFQHFELPRGYSNRTAWWREGEAKTFAELRGSSPHIVYIADTPHPIRDIPSCIAAGSLSKCNGTQPSVPIFASGFERIQPTSWLCNAGVCPGIVDGVVAYRDGSHISVLMSETLAPKLASSLTSLGILPFK